MTDSGAPSPNSTERAALAVFAVVLAVALVIFVPAGARNWFYLDEWDFLADRSMSSLDDLLRPHNEHWSTLPIIAYRIQWRLFGLRTYVPYVIAIVSLHLVAAALLRVVMRRSGVEPWLATAAASAFALLGSGFSDIIWAFQIGFTGALVAGLAHLVLSDHDGPLDGRDVAGLAFGLAGLMCAGVAITMVAVVGLAALLRRGWRVAAFHTVPLGVAFVLWWLVFGHEAKSPKRPGPGDLLAFVRTALTNAVRSMGHLDIVAVGLLAILAVGGTLLVLDRGRGGPRSAAPWALLAGALGFAVITALGRAEVGIESAKASRYVHLVTAMTIPAMAACAQAIVRRWRWSMGLVIVVLVAGIPGNIETVVHRDTFEELLLRGNQSYVRAIARAAVETDVPAATEPDRFILPGVTAGWLRSAYRSGRLEVPRAVAPQDVALGRARLLLEQREDALVPARCRAVGRPATLSLRTGERLRFSEGRLNLRVSERGRQAQSTDFRSAVGTILVPHAPLTVEISRQDVVAKVEICS